MCYNKYMLICDKMKKNDAGYTLMEVLMSLAIIAIFFVLFQAAASTATLNRNVKNQELALRIAQNQIENLRSLGYAALPSSGPVTSSLLSALSSGTANMVISQYNDKIKQAAVTVSWREGGTYSLHNISLTTLISEGGL